MILISSGLSIEVTIYVLCVSIIVYYSQIIDITNTTVLVQYITQNWYNQYYCKIMKTE